MATSTLAFSDLADSANKFMTGQAIAPYLANLPNYANMVGSRTENITQQLKGQLPQDVINQIGQQAAERGVSSGSPGSPNANSAYLRALGLNSLQMQQQGNQNLSGAIADTPVPQLFNPMSLVVPQMNAAQEMNAARLGRYESQPKNAWGAQTASVASMPNLSPARGSQFSPSASSFNGAMVTGPSWGGVTMQPTWGSPYAASMPQQTGGDWMDSWFDSSGGDYWNEPGPATYDSNYYSAPTQFDEEDAYFNNMGNAGEAGVYDNFDLGSFFE